ncbi:MAG: adenylate/guanylate cyclase domain-containing protein [Spirochaetales bacterium]|nr:adenylate/guanylate cyclase domain-containing protein [Spirochaetales bacterium]
MKIRIKIILVVLPLLIIALIITGISSYFLARTGITRVANDLLGFKTEELQKNAVYQWNLLLENELTEQEEFVNAAKAGILSFAQSLIKRDSEFIFAFDENINITMKTQTNEPVEIYDHEKEMLKNLLKNQETALVEPVLGGISRVATGFFFEPFQWYYMVTVEKNTFYQEVNQITNWSLIILVVSLVFSLLLLLFFATYLTKPLNKVVQTMKHIMTTKDLSNRVPVEYNDEIGRLAHNFNIMIGELEEAYTQIKNYAFKAVMAQRKEKRIRHIFQKYVPRDVIDQFFVHPEAMLVGENRVLSILFSDIRNFTTISEGMSPDQLVNSLNKYFGIMVDIIMGRKGVVDKYIGDAIMAFFGAPVKHEDDAVQSVSAGLDMLDAVMEFNKHQKKLGIPGFTTGIGINYGIVTVGNIGCQKKMDYTVIGDMVNLASRLEGLTKKYKQSLIISEELRSLVVNDVNCRMIDKVRPKGKTKAVNIYSVYRKLTDNEKSAWKQHGEAMRTYYNLDFKRAKEMFRQVLNFLPEDPLALLFIERCDEYLVSPPPPDWDGITIMKEK